MLNENQISEIREHLKKAVNPLFFFDNDVDGLCSFLILRKFVGGGKGVAIKSFPEMNSAYVRRIHELNPDYVFILDKPLVSREFLEETKQLNLPIVWIDHHDVEHEDIEGVNYYNPSKAHKKEERSNEPTTYLCYQATKRKEDEWLALLGCLSDGFYPEFFSDVQKKYPELTKNCKSAFQCVYETDFGKIIRMLSFGLKDRTGNVVKMLKFLMNVREPTEILEESHKTYEMHQRYVQIEKKYRALVDKAKEDVKGKMIYFQYGGDLSISAEIANELLYLYPGKIIVVAYISGVRANLSLRGQNVRDLTLKAIEGIENARGGGHVHATGAQVLVEDLPRFKEKIEKMIKEKA